MRSLFIIILFFGGILTSCTSEDSNPGKPSDKRDAFMHPTAQINFVRRQIQDKNEPYKSAYGQLKWRAGNALPEPHHALEDYNVPGYFEKPQEHMDSSRCLETDGFNAYSCALAYRLDAGDEYAEKACELLNAWATINKKYSGDDGALAMCNSATAMIIAAQLLSESDIWKKEDREQFDKWVVNVYWKACNEIRNLLKNNHDDWGRFGSMLCAVYFDDKEEIKENVRLIKSDLFEKIAADGSMPAETCRKERGIWYTYFSLAPMTAACWLVYTSTGENLFALEKDGVSIKKALDYLFYYDQHPDEWEWYPNQITGGLERWPNTLFEAMIGIYNDQRYVEYNNDFRPVMYNYHHYAWVFPTLMPLSLTGYEEDSTPVP